MGKTEKTIKVLYTEYEDQKEKRQFECTFEEFIALYERWKESSFDSFDRFMDYVEKECFGK